MFLKPRKHAANIEIIILNHYYQEIQLKNIVPLYFKIHIKKTYAIFFEFEKRL